MIRAIFFDFDGVLTLDATGTTSILNYFRDHVDVDIDRFEKAYRKHNGKLLSGELTHGDIWPELCGDLGRSLDIGLLYSSFVATPLDEMMGNILRRCHGQGYVTGVITDNKRDRIESIWKHHSLDNIVDRTVVSSEIGSGKKKAPIFHAALDKLNLCFEECLFIDNSRDNLVVPVELGMKTIFFDHDRRDYEGLMEQFEKVGLILKGE
ncbi:MAG: HAD hydrolase-like protein [Spirochaetales bacterium]|nr:HAD hydrolase-like protein [Spirochaetales bacterium]